MKFKRKKSVKQRGYKTHGYGSKKKHRGAGSRGGRGMAGSGKRADQKKPSIFKIYGNTYFGKRGFKLHNKKGLKTINLEGLLSIGNVNVDLSKMGYDKLLGKGMIERKLVVSVRFASKKAIEKIEKVGGKVILGKQDV